MKIKVLLVMPGKEVQTVKIPASIKYIKAFIGDELYRDIYGGNKVGIKTILVNPISKKDSIRTKMYRIFEKKIIKKLNKRGILIKGKYYE